MWTVTLLAMGLRQRMRVADVGGAAIATSTIDMEGRIVRHHYRLVAVDEDNRLATAVYEKSHVLKKRARRRAE